MRFPDNAEVEAELRAYRSLYQGEEHAELLRAMRQSALELLQLLAPFNPYLTGSVLDGTAGEHSRIDILLFADSAKEVEIFLLNRGIDVEHAEAAQRAGRGGAGHGNGHGRRQSCYHAAPS